MSRRYDQSTTTFSPEGRLHQVEYAIEAINNAGTCIGIQSVDGIVLAAEKKTVSKLLAPSKTSEKTYIIDDHVSCLIAGLTADANILIHQARLGSQRLVIFFIVLIDHSPHHFLLSDISILIKILCQWNKLSSQFVITSKPTPNMVAYVHLVLPFYLLDGINILVSNYIKVILLAIILDGRPLSLVRISFPSLSLMFCWLRSKQSSWQKHFEDRFR
jgi:hypothetical protein